MRLPRAIEDHRAHWDVALAKALHERPRVVGGRDVLADPGFEAQRGVESGGVGTDSTAGLHGSSSAGASSPPQAQSRRATARVRRRNTDQDPLARPCAGVSWARPRGEHALPPTLRRKLLDVQLLAGGSGQRRRGADRLGVRAASARRGAQIRELGLTLRHTLETHAHADHVTGAWLMREALGSAIVVSRATGARGADRYVADGDRIELGACSLEVRATPGHTNGCVTYVAADHTMAFTGDALLVRGAEANRLPGGQSAPALPVGARRASSRCPQSACCIRGTIIRVGR